MGLVVDGEQHGSSATARAVAGTPRRRGGDAAPVVVVARAPASAGPRGLWVVLIVAAVLRVGCALSWQVGFDEAMHMFIAKVPTLLQLWRELLLDTHPPLHHLLLRVAPGPEHSILGPRAVSIACSLGTLWLTVRILGLLGVGAALRLAAAVLLALSHVEVTIGVSVRSYALATVLWLGALQALLRLVQGGERRSAFAWACALAAAACWALYAAVLPLLALALAACLADVRARHRVLAAARDPGALLPFAGLAAAGGLLCLFVVRTVAFSGSGHVVAFFPQPDEGFEAFLARGTASDLACFTPLHLPPDPVALALLVVSAGILTWLARRTHDPARAVVLLALPLGWVLLGLLGWVRAYPFGGEMRHQYVLFPLLVLAGIVALDEAARRLGQGPRRGLAAALALAALLGSAQSYAGRPLDDFPAFTWRWQQDVDELDSVLRAGDALYLSHFNAMALWGGDWRSTWQPRHRYGSWRDRFDLGFRGKALTVLRPQHPWALPMPLEAPALREAASDLRLCGLEEAWIVSLCWDQVPRHAPVRGSDQVLAARCGQAGLELQRRVVLPHGEAVQVRRAR